MRKIQVNSLQDTLTCISQNLDFMKPSKSETTDLGYDKSLELKSKSGLSPCAKPVPGS